MDESREPRPSSQPVELEAGLRLRRPMLYPVELRPQRTDDLTGTENERKGLNEPAESWRAAAHWPEYEVSDLGRVRRGKRVLSATAKMGRLGFPPYLVVKHCRPGQQCQVRLNRLVAETWLGRPKRASHQADHKDGDTFNNRQDNLEWVTQAENQRRSHQMHPRARDERGRILPRAVAA